MSRFFIRKIVSPLTRILRVTFISLGVLLMTVSFTHKPLNYITYYSRVNEIYSIYRFKKDTLKAIKQYKRLFKKYPPKNQERVQEFETYIIISDRYHKDFGGKKTLYKLIPLIAPYGEEYKNYFSLYGKYGIDSLTVKNEVAKWKRNLNRTLIDSFSIAFIRDQQDHRNNVELMELDDNKNAKLLKWTFENYGYPSLQKIGLIGNNDVFMPMLTLFSHMSGSEYYPYFKTKMLEYMKSGDCLPRDYATMVDRHHLQFSKEEILYGYYIGNSTHLDTLKINRNRKMIGLPSMQHSAKIRQDFMAKLKTKQ
ncbi:hypothetical protein [uncultured Chryseobacterium sp.]|uniref:hypothetical protein n=1 Tax=uncultured Chryseobacterium sp. TaxID=259322 RepID=UPI0025D64039|nr:hypothetical protein [uncultured Chryseobacterium sp.]